MREERAIEVTREFLRRNERFGEVSELTGAKTASDGLRVRVDLIKGTYPYGARLKNELQECLKDGLNYDNIDVVVSRVASPSSNADDSSSPNSVKRVGSVVAVSSCKGGVGKSTVAVNLAYSMAQYGARVGILDLDVYGPSLPTLVNVPKTSLPLKRDPITKLLEPPTIEGVKLMSYGLIAKGSSEGKSESAVVRGPIASRVVQQMISGTDWGALDVLILDLPPGTGDIVLTTCQTLNVTAAIVVTTPQQLSYVDVIKGIDMFRTLNVPVVSVVENMAHFDVRGERFYPFGRGIRDKLESHDEKLKDAESFTLPIQETLSTSLGVPVVIGNEKDNDDVRTVFKNMAEHLGDWISSLEGNEQEDVEIVNEEKIKNQRLTILDDTGNTSIVSIGYDSQRVSVVLRFLQGPKEGTWCSSARISIISTHFTHVLWLHQKYSKTTSITVSNISLLVCKRTTLKYEYYERRYGICSQV